MIAFLIKGIFIQTQKSHDSVAEICYKKYNVGMFRLEQYTGVCRYAREDIQNNAASFSTVVPPSNTRISFQSLS